MPTADQADLAEFARTGSPAAFERLARRHAALVYGVCLRRLGSPADAEDAAQAVFIALARKVRSVRPESLAAWLHGAALKASLLAARSAVARARHEEEAARMRSTAGEPAAGPVQHWEVIKPHLDAELTRLPAGLREAVLRHYFGGLSHAELAGELGVPRSTAAGRVEAGVERLRRALARRGVALGAAALGTLLVGDAQVAAPPSLLASLPSLVAGGSAAGAAAGAGAQALAEGVLKMMFWAKVKLAAAITAAVIVPLAGGGVLARHLAAAGEQAAPAGPEKAVLSADGYWRTFFVQRTPLVQSESGESLAPSKGVLRNWRADSPEPPAGWTAPDFDDGAWPRWRPTRFRKDEAFDYGFAASTAAPYPPTALICMRGKFSVADPAKAGDLTLAMAYRGGVVVRVNGTEVARAHLPGGGKVEPLALAEGYPLEAFVSPQGKLIRGYQNEMPKYKENLEKRIRRLEAVRIPASALRKGVNVLAVEIHRAPYRGEKGLAGSESGESEWGTCGLVKLELRASGAVEPNLCRPQGLHVWNHPVIQRLDGTDYGDPNEPLRPIRLVGARNGVFSDQVLVSSTEAIKGLKAAATELKAAKGDGVIPATAVELRCALPDGPREWWEPPPAWFNALEEAVPEVVPVDKDERVRAAVQPVWITVRVPRDAAPGEYRGKVALSTEGLKPVEVPVELKIHDWVLPAPQDFTAFLDLIESPRSVALKYKVEPWSEEHWKILDRSFALMGQVGAKAVYITVLPDTYFGNGPGMIRWIKQPDGSYKHDFSIVDRYLDLAVKHLGRPPVVCVYLWDRRCGAMVYFGKLEGTDLGKGPDVLGTPYSLLAAASGKVTVETGPVWGTPEAREFWKPVVEGIRERLAKRGLEKSMMWGIASDRQPRKEVVEDLKALMPNVEWVCHSHPRTERLVGSGGTVAYIAHNWGAARLHGLQERSYGWQQPKLVTTFPRFGGALVVWSQGIFSDRSPGHYRCLIEATVAGGYRGIGRLGADFWCVLKDAKGRDDRVLRTTPDVGETWGMGLECVTPEMLGAGRKGPVGTVRLEMFRESLQEVEARISIEKALLDAGAKARLGDELAARCQKLVDERTEALLAAYWSPDWLYYQQDLAGRTERLLACAAEVAAKLGAK